MFSRYEIFQSNVLTQGIPLPNQHVHCCITSPPYFSLRDYGVDGQIGQEKLHDCAGWATGSSCGECFVCHLVSVFRHVKNVLRDDGVLVVNLGDSYSGSWGNYGGQNRGKGSQRDIISGSRVINHAYDGLEGWRPPTASLSLPAKNLCMIPARFALAMQADGWILRSKACWIKANGMTESVLDRPTNATEEFFLFAKSKSYFYDVEATKLPVSESSSMRLSQDVLSQAGSTRAKTNGPMRAVGDAAFRNRRTSDWWRESLGFLADEEGMPLGLNFPVGGFKGAHFATFPPKMIASWLRAATSEKGCCQKCGTPYRRVIAKHRVPTRSGENSKVEWTGDGIVDSDAVGNRDPLRHITTTSTVGWEVGCDCNAGDPVACRVLDCFSGAASTGIACLDLDLDFYGTELNEQYIKMSLKRLADHKEYLRTGEKPKQPKPEDDDPDQFKLFGAVA